MTAARVAIQSCRINAVAILDGDPMMSTVFVRSRLLGGGVRRSYGVDLPDLRVLRLHRAPRRAEARRRQPYEV
jgi:hypothetical protein